MPNSHVDVQKLSADLQNAKLVDFNLPAKSFIDIAHTHFGQTGGETAADWNVIGGSHYVLITGISSDGAQARINPAAPTQIGRQG